MARGFKQRCLGLVHLAKQPPRRRCGVGQTPALREHICAEAGYLALRGGWLICHNATLSLSSAATGCLLLSVAGQPSCVYESPLSDVGPWGGMPPIGPGAGETQAQAPDVTRTLPFTGAQRLHILSLGCAASEASPAAWVLAGGTLGRDWLLQPLGGTFWGLRGLLQ